MSATTLDVPAVNSSVPASVRITNVSVTSSERSESIDKVRLGDEDGNVAGTAFTDTDDDAVPGYMVGFIDNMIPAECNVDDDEDNDADEALGDTEVRGWMCEEDN